MSNTEDSETTNSRSGLRHRRPLHGSREETEQANDLASSLSTSEWRATVSDVNDALREVNAPNYTLNFTGEPNASDFSEGVEEITNSLQSMSLTGYQHIFSPAEVNEVGGAVMRLFSHESQHARQNRHRSTIGRLGNLIMSIAQRLVGNPVIQNEICNEFQQNPELANDILELSNTTLSLGPPDGGGERDHNEERHGGEEDRGEEANDTSTGGWSDWRAWFKPLVDAFWKIYENAKDFLIKMTDIGAKFAEAIVNGLRWLVDALMDPVGETRDLINDPEISTAQKILGVASLVASFIFTVLILRSGHIPRPLINVIGASFVAAASQSSATQSGDSAEVPRDD